MHYQLPPDISERLHACIATGSYRSEEEVLRDALDALAEREVDKLRRWHEGNQISIAQSRQGLAQPLDDQAVLARLHARLAAAGITE
jgi:Arc/MetJ-type ribon-helix-helix transcriptional regulator